MNTPLDEINRALTQSLKLAVLHVSKRLGMFELARHVTRDGLRILCYHGFALDDEGDFRKHLFMREKSFAKRLDYLIQHKYPVLPLGEALDRQDNGTLPPCSTAITIDDGFFSVFEIAMPHLSSRKLPATLYVSSYYAEKQNPVFRLVLSYMFWKTKRTLLVLDGLADGLNGQVRLDDSAAASKCLERLIAFGETGISEPERVNLAREIGRRLGVEYEAIKKKRILSLVNREEILKLQQNAVDIQLHTHRHRFPVDEAVAKTEIDDNRRTLAQWIDHPLVHFCYPSGFFSPEHFAWMEQSGVKSSTTCDAGLNFRHTNRQGLGRFLDGEEIPMIKFEAEMSGYLEILRRFRAAGRRILNHSRGMR